MTTNRDSQMPDPATVLDLLRLLYADQLSPTELETLAVAIQPYLARTRLPLAEAVAKISMYYLKDAPRVNQLLACSASPEWQSILAQVIVFANRHALYPTDSDASSWPDLDAYTDIQRKLPSYNFEGSLDCWITVTVVNRLRRFWRDQQALRVGGPGFKEKTSRDSDNPGVTVSPPRIGQCSLEALLEQEVSLLNEAQVREGSVGQHVETAELQRLVTEAVAGLAERKHDRLLPQIWAAVTEQEYKLREAADVFGLTLSQVHRRVEQVRAHLRQDPELKRWLYPPHD